MNRLIYSFTEVLVKAEVLYPPDLVAVLLTCDIVAW